MSPDDSSDGATRSTPARVRRLVRVAVVEAQARIATALGVSRARRTETVVAMLDSNARRAPGYWLQLLLATGIATLGLALGSTAVVIGGMLVSPLMGPIVELGMGFAVGSPLLVIRAFFRVALSVVTVVTVAASMTLALPFHELTPEITARTAPTLLDLLVAVFCALAAAYTTVRQTADTTAAAAGTAIGIALVPPLCVVGYGLGTLATTTASGAGLLFTANFSAIVLVAVLSFLALGYNQVEASSLEHDFLETGGTRTDRAAERAQRALRTAFGSRYGIAMRLFLPVVVLASVAVPLKRALDEVAWEVRVRDGIRRIVESEGTRAVQSALTVERHTVSLRLMVIGSPQLAAQLQQRMSSRISSIAGVAPTLTVIAVPDAGMLAATVAAGSRTVTPSALPDLREAEREIGTALAAAWPEASAGPLRGWSFELHSNGLQQITVRHLGPPLGGAGEEMLTRALSASLRSEVRITDIALRTEALVAAVGRERDWIVSALAVLHDIARTDSVLACVTWPASRPRRAQVPATSGVSAPEGPPRGSAAGAVADTLLSTEAGRDGRVTIMKGAAWGIRAATHCAPLEASRRGKEATAGRTQ